MVRVAVVVGVVVLVVAGFLLSGDGRSGPKPTPSEVETPPPDPDVPDVVDEAASTLRGRVLRPDDTPVPDATVHAGPFAEQEGALRPGVRTDASGRFEIAGLSAGAYLLSAFSDRGGAGYLPLVTVPSGDPVAIRLTEESAWVSGRVLDERDRPVPGGTVVAVADTPAGKLYTQLGYSRFPGARVRVLAPADAAGRFRLGPLPPGPCQLGRIREGYSYGAGYAVAPTEEAVIRIIRTGTVRGTVAIAGGDIPTEVGVRLTPSGRYVAVTPGPDPVPFELPFLAPGKYRAMARARGFRQAVSKEFEVVTGETAGPVAVVLRPATLVTGVVRDKTGVPIPGAEIMPRRQERVGRETSSLMWSWDPVIADGTGTYRVRLAPGRWEIRAGHPGHFPPADEDAANRTIDVGKEAVTHAITLVPTNVIAGTVRDAAGTPVAGLSVRLDGFFNVRKDGRATGGATTRHEPCITDEKGQFRIYDIAAEEPFGITVTGDIESPVLLPKLAFPPGEDRLDLEVTVVPAPPPDEADMAEPNGAELVGRVVDEQGRPVPDAIVLADGALAKTDPDGRFVLEDAHVGRQLVTYVAVGWALGRTEEFDAAPGPRDLGNLVLTREGLVIRGRVTDAAGAPLAGVNVGVRIEIVMGETDQYYAAWNLDATTDADGAYRVGGPAIVRADVYVHIRHDSYHAAERKERVSDGATFDFALVPHSRLRGRIAFSGPVPANLAITGIGAMDGVTNQYGLSPRWNPERREYEVGNAPAGRRRLVISANGYATVVTPEVEITAGRETVVPEITMTPGGTLAGTVLDAAGKPVPAARLTVWIPDRGMGGRADERGRFRIENVPPGAWKLQANHPEVHRVRTVPVTVEDGAVTTVDVRLPEK